MNEIEDDLTGIPEEHHQLFRDVKNTISKLIDERQLKWMSETKEFKEGMEIGLEIAALYGDKINELYETSTTRSDADNS